MRKRIGPPVAFNASGAHGRCVAFRRRASRKASVARTAGRSTAPVIVFGSPSFDGHRGLSLARSTDRRSARRTPFFFQVRVAVPLRGDMVFFFKSVSPYHYAATWFFFRDDQRQLVANPGQLVADPSQRGVGRRGFSFKPV